MHLYLNKLVLGDILINTQNATRNIEYLHVHYKYLSNYIYTVVMTIYLRVGKATASKVPSDTKTI